MPNTVSGFSRMSKQAKIDWLVENCFQGDKEVSMEFFSFAHSNPELQKVMDGFSENSVSNFFLPYGVAPNFIINGKVYCVPMVIEESSVVAAASAAAKYWMDRGGFHAEVLDTRKIGQLHFSWRGAPDRLKSIFPQLKANLLEDVTHLTYNMARRGGGVLDIELLDFTDIEPDYYQLRVAFETCDSMGANFINTVLEEFGNILTHFAAHHPDLRDEEREITILMAILSNYTPECIVRTWVECPVPALGSYEGLDAETLAMKFKKAVRIARIDPYRATTHNKGIFNGIDAVILATGNDFRAVEACGHTYAARDGQYRSLSNCTIENGIFRFWMDIPLAIGTVGGLTALHPLAKRSLEMLGNPSATELMMIIAATGLAQNFAAVRSLITTGIQKGHMKMHLMNILHHLQASETEASEALNHFEDKVVSFSGVRDFLENIRASA